MLAVTVESDTDELPLPTGATCHPPVTERLSPSEIVPYEELDELSDAPGVVAPN